MECEHCLNEVKTLTMVDSLTPNTIMGLKCCDQCIEDYDADKTDMVFVEE